MCLHLNTANYTHDPFPVRVVEGFVRAEVRALSGSTVTSACQEYVNVFVQVRSVNDQVVVTASLVIAARELQPSELGSQPVGVKYARVVARAVEREQQAAATAQALLSELLAPFHSGRSQP